MSKSPKNLASCLMYMCPPSMTNLPRMASRGIVPCALCTYVRCPHKRRHAHSQNADGKRIDNAAAGRVPQSSDSCVMQPAYNTMEGGRSRWKSPPPPPSLLLCFPLCVPWGPRIRGEDVDRKALYVQGGIEKGGGGGSRAH